MTSKQLLALATLVVGMAGCQSVPKSQFSALESQNRTLTEQGRAQLAEIENLKVHARHVEDQLIRAEEELARADGRGGRSHVPLGLGARLTDLAARYPALQYDSNTGSCKLDTDLLFDSGDAELKPGAERVLEEFAHVFSSPDAQGMKIMVVGHADSQGIKGREVRERYPTNWHLSAGRALAVADRLRKYGLPEERMGVAGFGQHQPIVPNDTAQARQRNRRVEIFVLGPETPIVGWNNGGPIYR